MSSGITLIGFMGCRSGSKGLPDKNVLQLDSKPLFRHALDTLCSTNLCKEIYFSSDSMNYISLTKGLNVKPHLRPTMLAQDWSTVAEVLLDLGSESDWDEDSVIILVQATQPFVTAKTLENVARVAVDSFPNTVVTGVEQGSSHPSWSFTESDLKNGRICWLDNARKEVRRQDLPKVYKRAGCAYAIAYRTLMETGSIYSENCEFVAVEDRESISIDKAIDFVLADAIVRSRKIS